MHLKPLEIFGNRYFLFYDPKFQPPLQDGECSTPETEAAPDSPLSGRFQALAAVTPPPIRRHVPPGYKPMITVVRNPFNPNHLNMTVSQLLPTVSLGLGGFVRGQRNQMLYGVLYLGIHR